MVKPRTENGARSPAMLALKEFTGPEPSMGNLAASAGATPGSSVERAGVQQLRVPAVVAGEPDKAVVARGLLQDIEEFSDERLPRMFPIQPITSTLEVILYLLQADALGLYQEHGAGSREIPCLRLAERASPVAQV